MSSNLYTRIDTILSDFYGFSGTLTDAVQSIIESTDDRSTKVQEVTTLLKNTHGNRFGTKSIAKKLINAA